MPFIVIYHCYRAISRKRPPALAARFGSVAPDLVDKLAGRRPIWVHAVSVGEAIAVKPLLAALRRQYRDLPIAMSTMTETGRQIALALPEPDGCLYFPFDYPFAVNRLLDRIDPLAIIIAETEIWPNFLRGAANRQIPVVIVNGRISDRSAGRYRQFSGFFAKVLAGVAAIGVQTAEDARRIRSIGAAPERVHVTRNLKYDIQSREVTGDEQLQQREKYRLPGGLPIVVAGSTHPGEEELLVGVYREIVTAGTPSVLVLVPRHPERADEVAAILAAAGLRYCRRSRLPAETPLLGSGDVLLVDTIGELMALYAAADVTVVGGSFVNRGGHNLLEPASLGRPVIFGEHMSNFREIAGLVIDYAAGIQAIDRQELLIAWQRLVADPGYRTELGDAGRRLLTEQGGATALNMAMIEPVISHALERA